MNRLRGWARGAVGLLGVAAVIGGLAVGSASATTGSAEPLWTCRGSALSVSLSGQNRVEPVVAGGSPDTVDGASPDSAQCAEADVGEDNLATPLGVPGDFVSAPSAYASTTITPELGPSNEQSLVATGGVENLAVNLGSETTILGVGVANASVTGACAGGTPTLTGTSQVANLTLGGRTLSLDPLLAALDQALEPLDDIVRVKLNEQVRTATGLTVDALHVTILDSTTNAPVLDVVAGQAVGGFDPAVCAPTPPTPPSQPVSSGTGTVTSSNSGVGLTDQAYNGNIGTASGPQATCGHLTMYFASNHASSLTDTYGERQVTRGRIVSCGAHPEGIVGARIDVIHIVDGKRLVKTGLRSRARGALTLILPLNLTSREIEFDYRGKLDSTHVTSKQILKLTVRKA
jgi:hypothetical protein